MSELRLEQGAWLLADLGSKNGTYVSNKRVSAPTSVGSPVFNADGEVISVHRAGLRQGPGFALSVPVKYAIPLMPPALRQRLGV